MPAGSRLKDAKNAANRLNAESNKGLPPRGAFVFYDWNGEVNKVYRNWGHVGLSLGNGEIIHNFGKSILKQDYTSLDSKKFPYIGWAYPPLTPPINREYVLSGKIDGTEKDITGIYDFSTSKFTFNSKSVQFGIPTDIPIIGNWDGKGGDKIGVFRPMDNDGKSRFYLVMNNWNNLGSKVEASDDIRKIDFGTFQTDIPLVGDWDGDGKDDIGGYDPTDCCFYLYKLDTETSSAKPFAEKQVIQYGNKGDIPLIGDWDGDGKDEIGVFRQLYPNTNTNSFFLDKGLSGGQSDYGPYQFGNVGDIPIVGDWNGDGKDEIGVYRPSSSSFYKDVNIPPDSGNRPIAGLEKSADINNFVEALKTNGVTAVINGFFEMISKIFNRY